MSIYPIPDAAWISGFPSYPPRMIPDAIRFGLLKGIEQKGDGYSSNPDGCSDREDDFVEVRDATFPFLFIYLYIQWFSVERPRAALEDLILDFRDVPLISYNELYLPSIVAGIAETSYETYYDRLPVAIKLHNKLYPVAQECLKQILGAA